MSLTELGFNRPSYEDILTAQEDRAKELFGETIDTSELTALGKYIRINAKDIDTLYQTLEGVYYARFPNTASGTSLDRLCPFAGITRNAATFARHSIVINGTAGGTVEAGFEVANEGMKVIFHTVNDYTIGSDGKVIAYVECNEAGTVGNLTLGSITTIVNPSADVTSITHRGVQTLGKERENDTDLRKRFSSAIFGIGSNSVESIKGAIMRVASVEDCSIIENATSSKVGRCNPYSFECVVKFDDSDTAKQLIAKAILEKKPIGIGTSGTSLVAVKDSARNRHSIHFTPATTRYIAIKYQIITDDTFEANGLEQIAEKLTNYINSLKIGETLYANKLYHYIYSVTGVVKIISLGIAFLEDIPHYSLGDVTLENNQIARTQASYIFGSNKG